MLSSRPFVVSSFSSLDSNALASAIRGCIDLEQGCRIHEWMIENGGMHRGTFFGNLLIQMYGKCGSIARAEAAFQRIHDHNSFSWKIMLSAYALNGHIASATKLFEKMPEHDHISWTTMISGHGRNGGIEISEDLFYAMPQRGVVSWNAMIAAYAHNGCDGKAARLGRLMHLEGVRPNKSTFVNFLELFRSSTGNTRVLQSVIEETELQYDTVVATSLLRMHARCGKVAEARKALERMPETSDLIACNSMVWAYSQNGFILAALEFFKEMSQRDVVSWTTLLTGFIHHNDLHKASSVFARMPEWNVVSWNSMIAGLGFNGELETAETMFHETREKRDLVTWNSLMATYSHSGNFSSAVMLFKQMDLEGEAPNRITWISLLDGCDKLQLGRLLHETLERSSPGMAADLSCILIDMYGKCGSFEEAWKAFHRSNVVERHNVKSWTAVIGAAVRNGSNRRAMETFHRMLLEGILPDKVTLISVLEAASGAGDLVIGKLIHAIALGKGWQEDTFVGTAILNMYSKCGSFDLSKSVFDSMAEKNLLSWTSMLAVYAESGQHREALRTFKLMNLAGLKLDEVAVACAFDVCGDLTALSYARSIHSSFQEAIGSSSRIGLTAGTACINMYAKCGDVASACEVFAKFYTWEWTLMLCTTMVVAFARSGHGHRARELFDLMELQGLSPDLVSFSTVLTACSQAGLVCDGHQYLVSMKGDYALDPSMEHYICAIDLLGRAGEIDRGRELLESMPFEVDGVSWVTLASSCNAQGDLGVARDLAAQLPASEAEHPGAFLTLSNLVATSSSSCRFLEILDVKADL